MQDERDKKGFSDEELIMRLRKSGLRATTQRLAILRALLNSRGHPSAEDIYNALRPQHPTLSLSTVYKTLQMLADAGQVLRIDAGGDKQRFDGYREKHHHAYCVSCGQVFDIEYNTCPLTTKEEIDGLKILSVKLYFEVICKDCQEKAGRKEQG